MADLRQLVATFPFPGQLEAIFLRPGRGQPVIEARTCQALEGLGLEGDRAAQGRRGGKRQVTLLQAEHLPVIAALLRRERIDAAALRRNLLVSGVNLLAAKALFPGQLLHLQVGSEVLLEITGPCEPCSKMEDSLGPGAYNALRGHGGMTARVVRSGRIAVGDTVVLRSA